MDLDSFEISLEHNLLSQIIPSDLTTLPGILTVKLNTAGTRKKCVADVLGGRADLGIAFGGEGAEGLEYIPIIAGPPVAMVSRGHALARKTSLRITDLRWAAQIWPPSLDSNNVSAYLAACMAEGFYPYITLETQDFDLIIRSILTQNMIHIASSVIAHESLSRDIITLPLIHEGLRLEAGFLVKPDTKEKPLIRSYIRAVLGYYSQ